MVPLLEGIAGSDEISKILTKRRSGFLYKTVNKKETEKYTDEGWVIDKQNKKSVRLKKEKPIDEQFEDKVWCTLARMGFQEMSTDRHFKIPISKKEDVNPKQIDVFAKDDGVVLVVECKSAGEFTNGSFRKEVLAIGGYKGDVIKSISKHFGQELKIGWVFATKNYEWNKSDIELAKDRKIKVLTDKELNYYETLTSHLGSAAKYQLLAEIFEGSDIKGNESRVPAVKGKLGGNTFYSFAIEPSRLLPIAFVAHRLAVNDDTILTYQRILNKKRLKSIREYLEKEKGYFPNSIVVNFQNKGGKDALRFDKSGTEDKDTQAIPGYLYLPGKYKSAFVIDGQHRLYGFAGTAASASVTVPVVAFENLDPYRQARMFVDINSKQVKVPKNLLNDLYADLLWDSKNESEKMLALISKIVSTLNEDRMGPLGGEIKFSSDSGNTKPITITTLTDAIGKSYLLGKVDNGTLRHGPMYSLKEPKMDRAKERAVEILSYYFDLFKRGVPGNWNLKNTEGGYLCTNNGLSALILVLRELFNHIEHEQRKDPIDMSTSELKSEIKRLCDPLIDYFSTASPQTFRDFRRQYGLQGQRNSSFDMMEQIKKAFTGFDPNGLNKYLQDKYSSANDEARKMIPELQLLVRDDIIYKLKDHFKGPNERWFYEGIPESVRLEIAQRKETDPAHLEVLRYFELPHYEKIISYNWELFKDIYGFKEDGNSKAKQLSWFDTLVNIRNKVSHPERGKLTQEEFGALKKYFDRLKRAISPKTEPLFTTP
jgi:DNA sulfur modification protein DndB